MKHSKASLNKTWHCNWLVWNSLFVKPNITVYSFKGLYRLTGIQNQMLAYLISGQLTAAERWRHLHKVRPLGRLAFPPQGVFDLEVAHHVSWPHCLAYSRPLWLDKLSPGCIEAFQQSQGTSTWPSALQMCVLPLSECMSVVVRPLLSGGFASGVMSHGVRA